MSTLKVPYIKLFSPGEVELLIGEKNIGLDWVKSFEYTYKETDIDECKITMAFSNISFLRLDFFRPSVPLWVRWGYLSILSDYRKLVITEVEWKYDVKGHIMTLTLIPEVDYKEEHGDLLYNATEFADTLVQEGSVEVQLEGGFYKYYWKSELGEGASPLAAIIPLKDESGNNRRDGEIETWENVLESNYLQTDIHNPRNITEKEIEKNYKAQFHSMPGGFMSAYDYHTPWDRRKDMGAFGEALEGIEASALLIWENFMKLHMPNLVKDNRDGETVLKEIGWADEPIFTLTVGLDIIKYSLKKAKDSEESKTHVCTKWELEDKSLSVTETSSAVDETYPFAIRVTEHQGASPIQVKYMKNANGCWVYNIADEDDPEKHFRIDRALFEEKAEESLIQKELLDNLGYLTKREGSSWTDQSIRELYTKHGLTWPDVQAMKSQYGDKRQLQVDILKGITPALVGSSFSFLYSGRSLEETFNVALANELNQLFYNTQVDLTIEGRPYVTMGFNIFLNTGNKDLSGIFHADEVTHKIVNGKYTLEITAYRVVQKVNQIRKRIQEKLDGVQSKFEVIQNEAINKAVAEDLSVMQTPEYYSGIQNYFGWALGKEEGLGMQYQNIQHNSHNPNTHVDVERHPDPSLVPLDRVAPGTLGPYYNHGKFVQLQESNKSTHTISTESLNRSPNLDEGVPTWPNFDK